MLEELATLCRLDGVSGREERVRAYLQAALLPYVDDMRVDALGNLIVTRKGEQSGGPRLLLAAHMDEVGFLISHITADGYLGFLSIGGIDRAILPGARLRIGERGLPAVVTLRPKHLKKKDDVREELLYLDAGFSSREEALRKVQIGALATFDAPIGAFGEDCFWGKAIDDRLGCLLLLRFLRETPPIDCEVLFSVQEELGTRGAMAAVAQLQPDIALVLEGTTASDLPGVTGAAQVCCMGWGPVVPHIDGGTLYDAELCTLLYDLAQREGIRLQTKRKVAGGTDAAALQRASAAVRVAPLSAAVRYLHSGSSVVSLRDLRQMEQMLHSFVRTMAVI